MLAHAYGSISSEKNEKLKFRIWEIANSERNTSFRMLCEDVFPIDYGEGQIEGAFNELAGALKHRVLILSILNSQNAKDGLLIGQAVFKALVKALFNAVGQQGKHRKPSDRRERVGHHPLCHDNGRCFRAGRAVSNPCNQQRLNPHQAQAG